MTATDPGDARIAGALAGAHVLVVGDVMLDDYALGNAQRISPEGPVPLIELIRSRSTPGGAANVARGIIALKGTVLLTGVIGDDDDGVRLRSAVEECGIPGNGLLVTTDRPTTTKLRVIANGQHIVRVDHEQRKQIDGILEERVVAWVHSHIREVDAVIVSDYAKGVISPETCTQIIGAARKVGVPIIVDPKGTDYAKYAGASVITPNIREAERVVRIEASASTEGVTSLASLLGALLPGTNVLITRGADGMLLRSGAGHITVIRVEAQEVHDVTGAGDTVVATLATALANGVALEDAVRLSNRAAAIAVTRIGAAAVTLEELTRGHS